MTALRRRGVAVLATAAAASLVPASVAAANFVGTATDPAGDAADPSPGRDITGVAMSYDRRSGELIGAVRLAGEPGATRAFVTVFAGTRTPTGCDGFPAAGFGTYNDELGATWLRLDAAGVTGAKGETDKQGYGEAIQQFEVTDSRLAGQALDCVTATLTEPEDPATVSHTVAPVELAGQPELSMRLRGVGGGFRPGRNARPTPRTRIDSAGRPAS